MKILQSLVDFLCCNYLFEFCPKAYDCPRIVIILSFFESCQEVLGNV